MKMNSCECCGSGDLRFVMQGEELIVQCGACGHDATFCEWQDIDPDSKRETVWADGYDEGYTDGHGDGFAIGSARAGVVNEVMRERAAQCEL